MALFSPRTCAAKSWRKRKAVRIFNIRHSRALLRTCAPFEAGLLRVDNIRKRRQGPKAAFLDGHYLLPAGAAGIGFSIP